MFLVSSFTVRIPGASCAGSEARRGARGLQRASPCFLVSPVLGGGRHPPETLQVGHEDDRVAGRADELQAVVTDELHWLVNLPEDLWKELSFLVAPDASSSALRSGTLTAALISGAFAERRIFREATSLPWSLCQGDIRANLRNLGGMPDQAPRGTVISLTDIVFLVRWRSGLSSLGLVFYGGPHLLRGGRRGVCPGLLQRVFFR